MLISSRMSVFKRNFTLLTFYSDLALPLSHIKQEGQLLPQYFQMYSGCFLFGEEAGVKGAVAG